MGTLYLVRHGQASFGAADYDQLSELGRRQAVQLGKHLGARGLSFDAVYSGTLRRHRQTWEGIAEGLAIPADGGLAPAIERGLDEYDGHAVIEAAHPGALDDPKSGPEAMRRYFRLLRDGLAGWMSGELAPAGLPTHAEFLAGVVDVLDRIRAAHADQRVLLVSSGGPISHAMGHVLQTPPASTVELNLRLVNTGVCELAFNARRHSIVSFNSTAHLESANWTDGLTYA